MDTKPVLAQIAELRQAEEDAAEAVRAIEKQREEEFSRRKDAFVAALNAELDTVFAERIKTAREARWTARTAELEAREAAALAGVNAKDPPGTILEEWRITGCSLFPDSRMMRRTGHKAIYDPVTRSSRFPENMSRWNEPKVGEFAYRLLKNDGTPGLQVVTVEWDQEKFRPVTAGPDELSLEEFSLSEKEPA